MDFIPTNQQVPAHYLNRQFGFTFNLPKLAPLADATREFPSIGQENALGLAVAALVRLETALAGQAQADDGQVAGSVAGWAAEVAAARTDVTDALAAVGQAFPTFQTSADIQAKLAGYAASQAEGVWRDPAALPDGWEDAI